MHKIIIIISIIALALTINLAYAEVTPITDEAYLQVRMKKGTLRGEFNDALYWKLPNSLYRYILNQLNVKLTDVRAEEQARVQVWLDELAKQIEVKRATKAELRAQRQAYLDMIAAVDAEIVTAQGE